MKAEPVVTASAVSGAAIALLSIFGIAGINPSTVETVVAAVLPVALSLLARLRVSPI